MDKIILGFALAMAARTKGYAVAVEHGLFQIQTVSYDDSGTSVITPHTEFVCADAALRFVREN